MGKSSLRRLVAPCGGALYWPVADRPRARALFAALTPEQRDWSGADLCAASRACVSSLDFPDILDRAGRKLA